MPKNSLDKTRYGILLHGIQQPIDGLMLSLHSGGIPPDEEVLVKENYNYVYIFRNLRNLNGWREDCYFNYWNCKSHWSNSMGGRLRRKIDKIPIQDNCEFHRWATELHPSSRSQLPRDRKHCVLIEYFVKMRKVSKPRSQGPNRHRIKYLKLELPLEFVIKANERRALDIVVSKAESLFHNQTRGGTPFPFLPGRNGMCSRTDSRGFLPTSAAMTSTPSQPFFYNGNFMCQGTSGIPILKPHDYIRSSFASPVKQFPPPFITSFDEEEMYVRRRARELDVSSASVKLRAWSLVAKVANTPAPSPETTFTEVIETCARDTEMWHLSCRVFGITFRILDGLSIPAGIANKDAILSALTSSSSLRGNPSMFETNNTMKNTENSAFSLSGLDNNGPYVPQPSYRDQNPTSYFHHQHRRPHLQNMMVETVPESTAATAASVTSNGLMMPNAHFQRSHGHPIEKSTMHDLSQSQWTQILEWAPKLDLLDAKEYGLILQACRRNPYWVDTNADSTKSISQLVRGWDPRSSHYATRISVLYNTIVALNAAGALRFSCDENSLKEQFFPTAGHGEGILSAVSAPASILGRKHRLDESTESLETGRGGGYGNKDQERPYHQRHQRKSKSRKNTNQMFFSSSMVLKNDDDLDSDSSVVKEVRGSSKSVHAKNDDSPERDEDRKEFEKREKKRHRKYYSPNSSSGNGGQSKSDEHHTTQKETNDSPDNENSSESQENESSGCKRSDPDEEDSSRPQLGHSSSNHATGILSKNHSDKVYLSFPTSVRTKPH